MKSTKSTMQYDTKDKKLKFLRKRGNIVTFKEPFYPNGTANESSQQIIVTCLTNGHSGSVKIEGQYYDTYWYDSIDSLLDAVDWDWMERMHMD